MDNHPSEPIGEKQCFLGFNSALDRQSITNLILLAEHVWKHGAQHITICIASPGGDPDQGLYAYNILSALPVRLTMHAVGPVQSAAVSIFMAASVRYAAPGGQFLFHSTVVPNPAPNLGVAQLTGIGEAIEHNDRLSAKIVSDRTGKPFTEVAQWYVGQAVRNNQFALANGIIQAEIPLSIPQGAQFMQVGYKF